MTRWPGLLLTASLLLASRPAPAEVLVPPTLAADETWTAGAGPYRIEEDVTVPEGIRLVIEPGVQVVLSKAKSLVVRGEIVARGTGENSIVFSGRDAGDGKQERWGSIVFEDTSRDAEFQGVGVYQAGSILENCTLEHASKAVQLKASSPFLHRCTFRDNWYKAANTADIMGGSAVYVGEGSRPRIVGCTFRDNGTEGAAQGGAICVDSADPIIQDNLFEGNSAIYAGALVTNFMAAPIVGNQFTGNQAFWEGGAVALVSSQPAFLNNRVTDNQANADGGGLHVCTTCFPHADPLVMDSTFTGNTTQVEGAAGVGTAYIRVFSWNNVHGNLKADEPSDFGWFNEGAGKDPDWATLAVIPNNWWGTTDGAAIDATIIDGADEAGLGRVSWAPALSGPVGEAVPRVTITTRHIVYEPAGEPMPVFLTLYNPTAASREVVLHVLLQYGEEAPLFYRGAIDFPGAVREPDGFRLTLPANAVWFTTLVAPTYAPGPTRQSAAWHAAIFDAESGTRIGDTCSIRFDLAAGGAE